MLKRRKKNAAGEAAGEAISAAPLETEQVAASAVGVAAASTAAAASSSAATAKRSRPRTRCGACGYVTRSSTSGKPCPACGASPEAFAPFEERLPERRARLVGLRLHPMASHAAPAYAATLLACVAAIAAAGDAPIAAALVDTTRVLSVLLPFAIAAAFLTGLADARARLKKRTTPLLIRKMAAGALFFAFSFATAALALFTPLDEPVLIPYAALTALGLISSFYLGRKGAGLRDTAVAD